MEWSESRLQQVEAHDKQRCQGVNELEVAKCEADLVKTPFPRSEHPETSCQDGNPKIWKTPDHSPAGMHMPAPAFAWQKLA